MTDKPCIIIADDHPLFRAALSATLTRELDSPRLLEASDFNTLVATLEQQGDADLVLLDLHMPGAEGFSSLVFLVTHYSHLPVMIVSAMEEPEVIRRAMDHGACGFLPKSASIDDMTSALNTVLAGEEWLPPGIDLDSDTDSNELNVADAMATLTPQQFRVATMVHQGLLNKQIAYELSVTEATVKAHMTEIFRKLGVHSRTQAALVIEQLAVAPQTSPEQYRSSRAH